MATKGFSNYFFDVFKSEIPIYFIPLYWGLNSVIFINLSEKLRFFSSSQKIFTWGLLSGVIISNCFVYIFSLHNYLQLPKYLILTVVPLAYIFLWSIIQKRIYNHFYIKY